MQKESRVYLLNKLKYYVENAMLAGGRNEKTSLKWHHHFPEMVEFSRMLKSMEKRLWQIHKPRLGNASKYGAAFDGKWRDFFDKHVKDDQLLPFLVESDEFVGDFLLISHSDLHVLWGKRKVHVSVFHREVDDRIVIYHWSSNDWEGFKSDDHYKIKWKDSTVKKGELFDGSNGSLYDTDGDLIESFLHSVEDEEEEEEIYTKQGTKRKRKK